MHGDQFDSMEQFAAAVRWGPPGELDAAAVVGKVYTSRQVDTIIQRLEGSAPGTSAAVDAADRSRDGVAGRYQRAATAVAHVNDLRKVEAAVLYADPHFAYPLVTYYAIKDWPHASAPAFKKWLVDAKGWLAEAEDHHCFACPFSQPAGRSPRLESLWFPKNQDRVAIVYGQTRINRLPATLGNKHNAFFVTRVPIVVWLLFDLKLVEISLPNVAEPMIHSLHDEATPQSFPGRAFFAIHEALQLLRYDLVPPNTMLMGINGDRVFNYLEQKCIARDLGWDIERPEEGGKLNTTQPARIPLKRILEKFATELAEKCAAGHYVNPLEGKNLYNIFRTIKSESHTISMVLGVPFGDRGGNVEITGYFGTPQDDFSPLYEIVSDNFDIDEREKLRKAVSECRSAELDDPYAISNFIRKSSP